MKRNSVRLAGVTLAVALTALVVAPASAAPSPTPTPASTSTSTPKAKTSTPPPTTFGVQPASAKAQDARPAFTYGVTPGASLRDNVAFLNYSTKPLKLSVYATDGLNTSTGGFSLEPAATKPVDAGSWIVLGDGGSRTQFVTVPARTAKAAGRVILPITVKVPASATPGDHVGGVVASLPTVTKNQGANVKLDQRVASRVYVRVSGELKPSLRIEQVHATYHGTANPVGRGTATVTYVVRNEGNVKLGGRQSVAVSGPLGSTSAAGLATIPLLLPGSSLAVRAEVAGVLPAFALKATVRVDPLQATGDIDPALQQATGSTRFWAVPWALLAIVLLLVLLAVAYVVRRRRLRAGPAAGGHRAGSRSAPTDPTHPNVSQGAPVS